MRAHVTAHMEEGERPSFGYLFESQRQVIAMVHCGAFDITAEPAQLLAWANDLRDVASRACHEQDGGAPVRGNLGEPRGAA